MGGSRSIFYLRKSNFECLPVPGSEQVSVCHRGSSGFVIQSPCSYVLIASSGLFCILCDLTGNCHVAFIVNTDNNIRRE